MINFSCKNDSTFLEIGRSKKVRPSFLLSKKYALHLHQSSNTTKENLSTILWKQLAHVIIISTFKLSSNRKFYLLVTHQIFKVLVTTLKLWKRYSMTNLTKSTRFSTFLKSKSPEARNFKSRTWLSRKRFCYSNSPCHILFSRTYTRINTEHMNAKKSKTRKNLIKAGWFLWCSLVFCS